MAYISQNQILRGGPDSAGWKHVTGRHSPRTGLTHYHAVHVRSGRRRHIATNGNRYVAHYTGGGKRSVIRRGKGYGP